MNTTIFVLVSLITIYTIVINGATDDMPCTEQCASAYDCLASTLGITEHEKINVSCTDADVETPKCLSCFPLYMEKGLMTAKKSCEEVQNTTFCDDVMQCIVDNCVSSCLTYVAAAYDCVLRDIKDETGCDICPFPKDFIFLISEV
ncbi:hypothetical protein ACHAW6_003244 [Cyclotella cf. meneghiniana]